MSSMKAKRFSLSLLAVPVLLVATACYANDGRDWDVARAKLIASNRGDAAYAVNRWEQLANSSNLDFSSYAGFLLAYPGFPDEDKLRAKAERALAQGYASPGDIVAYFDKQPPLSNSSRAKYAIALQQTGRSDAGQVAVEAWRKGDMADADEQTIYAAFGSNFSDDDNETRMDQLLWQGASLAATRQIGRLPYQRQGQYAARLGLLTGTDYSSAFNDDGGVNAALASDPGYIYQRARYLRRSGNGAAARSVLTNHPPLSKLPADPEDWIVELLANAKAANEAGDPGSAYQIALSIDEGFAPGTDIAQESYRIRDSYTDLAWLGGTSALWKLGNPLGAAPLFFRYGAAAQTPPTRSKGFYWAGRAAARGGDQNSANKYFEMAAQYPTVFYGQLALERLGRPQPGFTQQASAQPTDHERQTFARSQLVAASREAARDSDWTTTVRFFRTLSGQMQSNGDYQLLAEFAQSIGRRDLGVILGGAAESKGYGGYEYVSFPLIPVPTYDSTSWTMIHALSRQESQFAANALSHAGARGLMQLMPGTAREQAGKMGLGYDPSALVNDPQYNMTLGSGYFGRMMSYYNGSYPLAVAAYNAGPGNVNKWLRNNGDPRNGSIAWVDWIERIPVTETRYYVQHVLGNAVVYNAMNPDKASYTGPYPVSHFLGKQQPG